jgi:hypothetical protein
LLNNLISKPEFCMLVHFPLWQNVESVARTFCDYVLTLITESYTTFLLLLSDFSNKKYDYITKLSTIVIYIITTCL